jgi:hypothetical protein
MHRQYFSFTPLFKREKIKDTSQGYGINHRTCTQTNHNQKMNICNYRDVHNYLVPSNKKYTLYSNFSTGMQPKGYKFETILAKKYYLK